ncbi:MAG: LamG-like jellyroll fold domain-containing protein [Planctomycetaceae bacterium]|nr:PEP-CTERM sorting domain-containing protein [Planctomycetaceae bacterium]
MRNKLMMCAVAGLILVLAGVAQATVTTVALYHMGEDGDDLNVGLIAATGTDAAMVSRGTSSIETGSSGAAGSTKYLQTQQGRWSAPTYLTGTSTNWGMSAWLLLPPDPAPARPNYMAVSNGNYYQMLSIWDTNPNGWIHTGNYAPVTEWGTWVHAAIVYNGSNNREFYLNGVQVGTGQNANSTNPVQAAGGYQAFWIGTGNANTGGEWLGGIDEVHVFSFEAGAFNISDVYQTTIPEPATMSLLAIGGIAALIRRKRS